MTRTSALSNSGSVPPSESFSSARVRDSSTLKVPRKSFDRDRSPTSLLNEEVQILSYFFKTRSWMTTNRFLWMKWCLCPWRLLSEAHVKKSITHLPSPQSLRYLWPRILQKEVLPNREIPPKRFSSSLDVKVVNDSYIHSVPIFPKRRKWRHLTAENMTSYLTQRVGLGNQKRPLVTQRRTPLILRDAVPSDRKLSSLFCLIHWTNRLQVWFQRRLQKQQIANQIEAKNRRIFPLHRNSLLSFSPTQFIALCSLLILLFPLALLPLLLPLSLSLSPLLPPPFGHLWGLTYNWVIRIQGTTRMISWMIKKSKGGEKGKFIR